MQAEIGKDFYMVQVQAGCEDKVKERLLIHINNSGSLKDNFGEVLVPKQKFVELRQGKKRMVEKKLYPGYIIVEMVMNDESWVLVKSIRQVLSFIGGKSGKPAALSVKEVEKIRNRVTEGDVKPKHKVMFEPGEAVRIIAGPFADYTGVVKSVLHDEAMLSVHVNILGRETPLQLNFAEVEKA